VEPGWTGGDQREIAVNVARECGSKQGYLSKAEAKRVVHLMGARHRDAFHLYTCPHCRLWHVAHIVPEAIRASLQRFPTRRAWQVEAWSA
jgi:hypothetical protein